MTDAQKWPGTQCAVCPDEIAYCGHRQPDAVEVDAVELNPARPDTLEVVLMDIRAERERQDAKWGDQSGTFDGTGPNTFPLMAVGFSDHTQWAATELSFVFTDSTDTHSKLRYNGADMSDILLEEVFEALAEDDPIRLRGELMQVAAVAAAWMEYLDRRGANRRPADA